ncbi:AMP-binding protein [Roseicyclus mahoneyensis]|uniref:Acyl-CoA synthetase (AMP-forming)/AMP-acid ligase II n=1 Tax=Roseicyclus mahoneyensis TaxID=164332 RepID=A0A316GJA7_9RHOB|nr:AMP-binding protein [Roseicyclus mahoneyensis]PWK54907.1 acyl-CoA synthetase (AMP-forming)/AMP-acid ligase II [Roseicyclus mahoneyensis]
MNVTSILFDQVERRPEALAIRRASGDLSYAKFGSMVALAAGGLQYAGVRAGHVIAVMLDDPLDHWLATLAMAHIGAIVFSIPRSMPIAQRERLLAQTRCTWLLSDDDAVAKGVKQIGWSAIRNHESDTLWAPVAIDADQPWIYLSGSGSTGRPKIFPITQKQQISRIQLTTPRLPYGQDDVLFSLIGVNFSSAKSRMLEAISLGAGIYFNRPDLVDCSTAVHKGHVTALYCTPFHLEAVFSTLSQDAIKSFEKISALMVAGAPVSMALRERVIAQLNEKLFVLWGTNETGIGSITRLDGVLSVPEGVGYPVKGFEIEIVDQDGAVLPYGVDGLVRVASPTMVTGYLNDPEATHKAFRDGWFYPGDVGHLTADGQLVHRGRADDMMIVSGVNVYPVEVEACLREIAGVSDALVKPLRHPHAQEVPVALVVREPEAKCDARALVQQVRDQIGRYTLHDVVFVECIPRNEHGKVQGEVVQQILRQKWGESTVTDRNAGASFNASGGSSSNTMSITFKLPPGARKDVVLFWLSVLDDDLALEMPEQRSVALVNEGQQWLDVVLRLAMGLLHVLRIPVFETLKVQSCVPEPDRTKGWQAICHFSETERVSRTVVEGVLKVAFKLAGWAGRANPESREDRDRFFQIIETDVRCVFAKAMPNGKSTFEVLRVAHRFDIPCFALPGGVFQLGMGSTGRRIDRSTTDHDSALGMRWTQNKMLTAQLLRLGGLPAPRHVRVTSLEQAKQGAERIGFPVVIKPTDLERGEGVTVDVRAENLEAAFNEAHKRSPGKSVLVEQQVPGVCHRLFIVDGRLLYAVRRLPIGVYADGWSRIEDLVAAECEVQDRLPPWKRSGIRPLDDMATYMLRRQGWTSNSVPEAGRFVALRRIETTAWGGVDEEVTNAINPENVRVAIEAVQLFGLEVAGVDIISQDIKEPWYANGSIINEVNYAPLLGGGEISRSRIPSFLRTLIRNGGRIPIHVHVGGVEALKIAKETWKQLVDAGMRAALVGAEQVWMPNGEPQMMPLVGLHARCCALILSSGIDALVLIVQDDEFIQTGLPFDRITSLNETDGALMSFPQGCPLDASAETKLRDFLRAWRRNVETDAMQGVRNTGAIDGA